MSKWTYEPSDIQRDKYVIVCKETGGIIAQDVSLNNVRRICAMKEMFSMFTEKKEE